MIREFNVEWGGFRLPLGRRTCVMGILNVTPDSFSDGGRFHDTDAAVDRGLQMVAEGADILDIGGESTRPYADAVSIEEESRRVVPVIEKLAARVAVPISIDTTKAEVARRALDAGAAIINDISALRQDERLAAVAARRRVPVILMHMQGTPKDMQVDPRYTDLLGEIRSFLARAVQRATAAGIDRRLIMIDPGIGFGKTVAHNLRILRHLDAITALDLPVLVGASRKFFIRSLLKDPAGQSPAPDDPLVACGSHAAAAAAVLHGAHIVRVHDVAGARAAVSIIDAIKTA